MKGPGTLSKQTSVWAVKEMTNVFELLDLDGNGDLDEYEFKTGLQSLQVNLTPEEAMKLFKRIDTENNGYVDKESFLTWLRNDTNSEDVENFRQQIRMGLQHMETDPDAEVKDLQIAYEISDKNAEQMDEDDTQGESEMEEDESGVLSSPNPPSENDASPYANTKGKKTVRIDDAKATSNKNEAKVKTKNETFTSHDQSRDTEEDEKDMEKKIALFQASQIRRHSKVSDKGQVIRGEDVRKNKWSKEDLENVSKEMQEELQRLVKRESRKSSSEAVLLTLKSNGVVDPVSADEGDNRTVVEQVSAFTENQRVASTANDRFAPPTGRLSREKSGSDHYGVLSNAPSYQPPTDIVMNSRKGSGSSRESRKPIDHPNYAMEIEMGANAFDRQLRHSLGHSSGGDVTSSIGTPFGVQGVGVAMTTHTSQHQFANVNQPQYMIPSTDISQITEPLHSQQDYFSANDELSTDDENAPSQYLCIRVLQWYTSPFTRSESITLILYHGANFVLGFVAMTTMLLCLVIAMATLPICCMGLVFLYVLCELGRLFGKMDIALALYFFPSHLFPKFAMYIPISHSVQWKEKFDDYVSDPHVLKIVVYECFVKTPVAFFLSGICLILLSGVLGIMLAPLMYWIMPGYFEDNRFCLFGRVKKIDGNITCSGWAVVEFGDTIGAFFLFLPILPLTMHLCRYSARGLLAVTNNFLAVDVSTTARKKIERPFTKRKSKK